MDKRSRIILYCLTFFGLLSVVLSCEKDDICADESLTPYLIINFVESADIDELDDIEDLQIKYISDGTEGDFDRFVYETEETTDSITLLLPTNKNYAKFIFMQNYNDNGDIDEVTGETTVDYSIVEGDVVEFFYNTEEEYVSRACGFRTIYSDLRIEITEIVSDTISEGFINSIPNFNQIIEDEDEAHVLFAH